MKLVMSLLGLLLIGFSGTAFADSGQHINQWLNDITADNVPTRLEGDGYVIVVNQVLDKSEYKVGDTIFVRPELVNIGNKTVTIRHLAPLFQTLVKNQNGGIVWPSIGTAYALRSDKIALEPHKPISDESNGTLQHAYPIILRDVGKYTVISSAYFDFDDNDLSAPMHTIRTEPLEITVLSDYSLGIYKLSPLKQFKSGIPTEQIQCKEGLVLIQKIDYSPVCIKSESLEKLRERGWVKLLFEIQIQPSPTKSEPASTPYSEPEPDYHFDKTFTLIGKKSQYNLDYLMPNGTITDIQLNCDSLKLVLSVSSTKSGILTLLLPEEIIGNIETILVDKMQWNYISYAGNTVIVMIPENTETLEIKGLYRDDLRGGECR